MRLSDVFSKILHKDCRTEKGLPIFNFRFVPLFCNGVFVAVYGKLRKRFVENEISTINNIGWAEICEQFSESLIESSSMPVAVPLWSITIRL